MGESDVLLRRPGDDGTLIDVLDRVLDKGVVITMWGRLSLVGIELVGVNMHMVVASIDTYLRYADILEMPRRN
jgi:gas vesicle structural protein